MKNLKIKFGLFSLLAILAVSVFLTSCEQEQVTEQLTTNDKHLLGEPIGSEFMLPYGYDELSEEEKEEYLDSLDPETVTELVESAKIANYFVSLGKYGVLDSNSKRGDIFNTNTLSSYLTTSEVETYGSDFQSSIESRGCGSWFNVGSPCWCACGYYYYGYCYDWRCAQKQKKICDWWFDQYRYVGSYSCY